MNKISGLILAGVLGLVALAMPAKAEDIAFSVKGMDFLIPAKVVDGVQLYSFDTGKGYPGVQTVLVKKGDGQLTFGAAAQLGTSEAVPFVGLQFRLPREYFDVDNNELHFGAFGGWPGDQSRAVYGLLASIPLW